MHSIRIGSVAGIELRLDWSIVVIFWLLTWDFAAVGFPEIAPGYPTAAYWAVAIVATALFLVTLAAHEMSHSVVARRRGVSVRDITLWMLGGIATIEGHPKSPRDDLAIAVAGPATSAAIGIVGVALGMAGAALSLPKLIVGAILWVAMVNVVLAVFNLAPAAPLDGGRILRAWLWHRSGDRLAAAAKAAHAGVVFAWLLVAVGFVEFALGGTLGGLWLIILGMFVLNAARAEQQQAELEHDLGGVPVRDVMTAHPTTAPDSVNVARLVDDYVFRSPVSAFPLVGPDGRVSGLVTLNDCKAVPAGRRDHVRVGEIAKPIASVPKAVPDEPIIAALGRTTLADRRLLVFDGADLVGIVTPTDVMRVVRRAPLRPVHRDAA